MSSRCPSVASAPFEVCPLWALFTKLDQTLPVQLDEVCTSNRKSQFDTFSFYLSFNLINLSNWLTGLLGSIATKNKLATFRVCVCVNFTLKLLTKSLGVNCVLDTHDLHRVGYTLV